MIQLNKRQQLDIRRSEIVDDLLRRGWKPNKQYFISGRQPGKHPDERGRGGYYDYFYLISRDNEMALTVKPMAVIAHQASRSYAKVLSMLVDEIRIDEIGIRAGKLIISH